MPCTVPAVRSARAAFIADHDCDLQGGKIEYIACPFEALLMEHCYKCYLPEESQEAIICDGWSEEYIRAQCARPIPSDQ